MTAAAACVAAVFIGCGNPTSSTTPNDTPVVPSGATVIYSDGFGGDLSKWALDYMVLSGQPHYQHMRITADAAHTGKYSLTTDSNQTALIYELDATTWVESGIAGVQFYIMAKEKGGINFTVEIGKNAGSSGGLGKAFGIGFDPNDSIKCKRYEQSDSLGNEVIADSMIGPIQLNHWYKCVVEVNFTTKTVTYSIDDAIVRSTALPTTDMAHIDRLLVFRGQTVGRPNYGSIDCKEGPKQYYADDIVFYKK
jgi:hypothetical protein